MNQPVGGARTMTSSRQSGGDVFASFKAAFFDIDGTLVDSNEFHVVAWDETFRKHGRSVPRDNLRDQIGKGADILIPSLFPDIREQEQRVLTDAHSEIFKSRFLKQVRPFEHSSDLIRVLSARGIKTMLVSSSDEIEVRHYVQLLGVVDDLGDTVSSEDVTRTKPAGDLFAVALDKSAVGAQDAIAIGDTPYDIEAAAKCKMRAIALRSGGFSEARLRAAGPIEIVMNIDALFFALERPL
jgi:HAD superfamily hydrolase (TIGR01509 family)